MNFWQSLWSGLRGKDGSRREVGEQRPEPAYGSPAAVTVTEDTAMQISAVWACVRLLAETVASLPLTVYRKTPAGREEAPDHWFAKLMRRPNQYQTKIEFLETMMLNLALHGNCYARKEVIAGRVRALMPLMASQVETHLMPDGSVVYLYTSSGQVTALSSDSVWHVKLYGNAIVGKSPLAFGRNMLGIAQASEMATSKVYASGGKRSGVLTLDKLLTPEQRTAIRQNFAGLTTGDDSRLLVLEMGMKFDPISMSPQDIELLASRRFQIEEICRWFGVPSVLVNDTQGSTTWGSGIEQLVAGFYKLNLRPYLERFEASIEAHLWGGGDEQYEVEFDFEGLLRADLKSRLEGYRTAIAGSILTPNEVREIEGWSRIDGGDSLLSQINMAPIQTLGQQQKQGVANVDAA